MINLRIIILLALIIVIPECLQSQSAPGYLGKKTTIGIGYGIRPSYFGPDKKNRGFEAYDNDKGSIAWDNIFAVELSHTFERYRSISLMLTKFSTGSVTYFRSPIILEDESLSDNEYSHEYLSRLDVLSIGLLYNMFKPNRGSLAPMGNTFSFGLKRNMVNSSKLLAYEYTGSTFTINDDLSNLPIDPKFNFYSFVLAYTNTQIYGNNFYLKSRFMFAGSVKGLIGAYGGLDDFERTSQKQYELTAITRIQKHDLFSFDLSVGLIF